MSNKVYNTLLSSKLAGNIGELKSIIQSCCVNSLFDREGNNLLIHLSSLPSHVLTKLYENPKTLQDTEEYVSVDDLQMFYSHDTVSYTHLASLVKDGIRKKVKRPLALRRAV